MEVDKKDSESVQGNKEGENDLYSPKMLVLKIEECGYLNLV